MSYNELTIPQSMEAWCAGLADLGQYDNTHTGLMGDHQFHITVTNDTTAARVGVGWHISMYQLGANGYLRNDWKPSNAIAKIYFWPAGEGLGANDHGSESGLRVGVLGRNGALLVDRWGRPITRRLSISRMPPFESWKSDGWEFFFSKYPRYDRPATFVDTGFTALAASSSPAWSSSASSSSASSSSASSSSASSSSSSASSASA